MNQRIGYARISMVDQHLDLQRDALAAAGCSVIYEESLSGKSTLRPEPDQCRKALRAGDTLVVWRLDRLGRNLSDLLRIVGELEHAGIGFESLTEKIETSGAAGRLVFHVFAALSEFERNLIRGRSGGRKPKLNDWQVREIKALLRDPAIPVCDVAKKYGVSRTTLYKHIGVVHPRHSESPRYASAR